MPQLINSGTGYETCSKPGTNHGDGPDIPRAQRFAERGFALLDGGDAAKARTQFRSTPCPVFPDAHVGLGHVEMGEKRLERRPAQGRRARAPARHAPA